MIGKEGGRAICVRMKVQHYVERNEWTDEMTKQEILSFVQKSNFF